MGSFPAAALVAAYAVAGGLVRWLQFDLGPRFARRAVVRVTCCAAAEPLLAPVVGATLAWYVVAAAGAVATWVHVAPGPSPTPARARPGAVALVTGAGSGIGFATAVALARRDYRVVVAARTAAKAAAAAAAVEAVAGAPATALPGAGLELTDADSVRAYAAAVAAAFPDTLAVVVLNAGVMRPAFGRCAGGAEVTMAANHLGHFLLATTLAPALERAAARGFDARVVAVTSCLHRAATRTLDRLADRRAAAAALADFCGDAATYSLFGAYAKSKLCNVLFARAFAARHPTVAAVAAHPGVVRTDITRGFATWVNAAYACLAPLTLAFFKTRAAGARASVHAALAPEFKRRFAYVADAAEAAPSLPREATFLEDALWAASERYYAAR